MTISPSVLMGIGLFVSISNSTPRAVRTSFHAPCVPWRNEAQHAGELPDSAEFQAVEVEVAVVDLGARLDDVAAAIVAAIADGDLEGFTLVTWSFSRMVAVKGRALRAPWRPPAHSRSGRTASSTWMQPLRKIGGKPDAGDVEEGVAVDGAEVDRPRIAGQDDVGGLCEVHRDAERAGEVVGRAQRNDAEREAAFLDRQRAGGDGAVAAAQDDEIRAFAQPDDVAGDFRQRVERLYGDVETAGVQPPDNGVYRFAATARFGIDEQQRPFLDLFKRLAFLRVLSEHHMERNGP